MAFFCINCKSGIDPNFKACPFCGEPITDFLRKYLENPIDGKYQILSRLGVGGMGEVYKVLHVHLNSIRVIKLMRASISGEETAHDRFAREARLATRIHHPNVATLFDFSSLADGSYYMVWEYIEGTNLMEVIRARGCLSPKYTAQLAIQALQGLDAIHRVGIVHRDVSPENLMIMRDEEGQEKVKIIDLGIAKQWGDTADDKTKTGMFVGKWKYCSPEHLGMLKDGERIDGRADIYSFGIVMYEMLTGTPPFIADTPHRYLLLHAAESPKPLSIANPGLHCPELESVIFKALEKDREKRFATAREFAKALEALLPVLQDATAAPQATEYDDETTAERLMPEQQAAAPVASETTIERARDGSGAVTVSDEEPVRTVVADGAASAPTVVATMAEPAEKTLERIPEDDARPGSSKLGWLAAAAALALAIAGGAWMMQRHPADVTEAQAGSTVNAQSTAQLPVRLPDTPMQRGKLALNAFPWGEVTMVRNLADGKTVDLNGKIVTPAAIDLAPGRYEVTLANPSYANPVTRVVEVAPGESRDVMFEFESASTAQYPFEGAAR